MSSCFFFIFFFTRYSVSNSIQSYFNDVVKEEETTASSEELSGTADTVAASCNDMLRESVQSNEAAKNGVQAVS